MHSGSHGRTSAGNRKLSGRRQPEAEVARGKAVCALLYEADPNDRNSGALAASIPRHQNDRAMNC